MSTYGNSEFNKSHMGELVKQYSVFEVAAPYRLTDTYTAYTDAPNNAPCVHTEYDYDGTSTRITKMKESVGTWNSSWDI